MYYFCNAPKSISNNFIPSTISGIISFKNFALCAIFNASQLLIFENKTTSLIAYYQRSHESIEVYGNSTNLEWNSDASLIAISTEKGFLLIFSIQTNSKESIISFDKEISYSKEGFLNYPVTFSAEINLLDVINFNSKISCLCLYREDLLIAIEEGTLTRIKWDGRLLYNQEFKLTSISFFSDLEFSKASNLANNEALCRNMEWFPSLSGVIILFQNGKSAFLHIPNHKLYSEQITGVWAEYLRHATCVAVNVKFRSVAYGLKIGEAVIYKTDEETGALRLQHRLKILCSEYPNADKITGTVTNLKWSPDNFCLALCWENKGFSLWSVQGSLLFSSLGNKCGIEMDLFSLDWGCEGYSLWAIKKADKWSKKPSIFVFQMAKSVLMINPTKDNHEHLLLLSSSYIIIGSRKHLSSSATNLEYIHYPEIYIGLNWPIKYAAMDSTGTRLAISGKYGFAIYFLISKKWRLFGNETQEHSIEVSGGMVWYKQIICLSCFDNKEDKLEIRLYNSLIKIDNSLSFNFVIYSQILMMNIFDNTLVTLSIDGLVSLYEINFHQESNTVSMEFIQIISLENYIEFAACVVSFNLTSLHTELNSASQYVNEPVRYQSLLINYSGHLLMFQRDKSYSGLRNSGLTVKAKENSFFKLSFRDGATIKQNAISFTGPLVVAYNVEIMWTPLIYEENESKPIDWNTKIYTMENALWLNCGSHGLRVWLPLNGNHMVISDEKKAKHSFLSKRIMLTCKISNFYPLVVLNNEALLMCPVNEFSLINVDTPNCQTLPFANMTKNRHIFLQHIIKELLRINLGIHALDLTLELKKLPYFNHSLELLLHEVLEEEATSKEPIPDPLLPRVVAFIQEFPNFLKTVVQCARKTELALWSYLFESAGNPEDLFESCLMNNELDTAASYLIILQNTVHPTKSQKHAILLLDSALNQSNWFLVRNLIRFLKNIAINELKITEKPNNNPTKETTLSSLPYITRRRYRSGGGINITGSRQYTNNKSLKDLETLKIIKHTSNQCKSINTSSCIDESSSDEFGIDVIGQKIISLASPTLSNIESDNYEEIIAVGSNQSILSNKNKVPISTDEKVNHNSHSFPNNTFNEPFDTSNDSSKSHVFDKEVDTILTIFAQKQFHEYHIHNLIEFFVNIQFTENQIVTWMVRERLSCSKIINPVQALLYLHDDFNWPIQNSPCHLKECDQSFINISTCIENQNQILCSNVKNSTFVELNRRKLRYFANILIKVEYWEWIFLFLLMLEECEEIISLFQYFALSVNSLDKIHLLTDMMDFMNILISWNLDEETKYTEILLKVKCILISLFEERINEIKEQKLNLSIHFENIKNKNTKLKEESLILSPVTKHSSLNLGQLIIDTVEIDNDIANNDTPTKAKAVNKKIETLIDKISLKNGLHSLSKERLHWPMMESPNAEKLKNAYNLSKNIQGLALISSDPLVSTELEEQKYSLGCSLS